MRNRVEDIGRLMVMIDQALDNELFKVYSKWDSKTFLEHFDSDDNLEELGRNIEIVKSILYECWEIAKGEDYLNQEE